MPALLYVYDSIKVKTTASGVKTTAAISTGQVEVLSLAHFGSGVGSSTWVCSVGGGDTSGYCSSEYQAQPGQVCSLQSSDTTQQEQWSSVVIVDRHCNVPSLSLSLSLSPIIKVEESNTTI